MSYSKELLDAKKVNEKDNFQEQILTLMFIDLVEHELLSSEEAELAKRLYLKNSLSEEKTVAATKSA